MIRLLTRSAGGRLELKSFIDDQPPPYAILSHTWRDDQEVMYSELISDEAKHKSGYAKLEFCVDRAAKDDLQYAWVDTCCIDKSDSIELSTAINSMFRWYQRAAKCYVLLSDVQLPTEVADPQAFPITWEQPFRRSRWFKRGWTLQELLAPPTVEFFSREGRWLGSKISLEQEIHEITKIPVAALRAQDLSGFSVEERIGWGAERTTKWNEDKVYCLLGLVGVFLAPIYGEGEAHAIERLREEIRRRREGRGTTRVQDLRASSSLPFPRSEHFVGRDKQLQFLEQFLLSPSHRRTSIYGLGGCGKSALAIEFAYRALARGGWHVLWVPALGHESFELAYQGIGTCLRISGIADDNADVKQLVKDHLSSGDAGDWLMIVDNADDSSILLGGIDSLVSARLIDYIPQSTNGKVLFTTRSRKAAGELTPGNVIELNDMSNSKNEAQQLLERRISHPILIADSQAVNELLYELTYLPLAIVQAAASMDNNDISASEYLALLRDADSVSEVFGELFEDHSRYLQMDSTIAKTWQISFEQIRKQDALATEYLAFMACVDRVSIPQSLLPPGGSRMQQLKAIGTLKGYAFIRERQWHPHEAVSTKLFDMHRLVHMALAWWLEGHGEQISWVARAATRLEELVPYGEHEKKEVWIMYLAHAIHVTRANGKLEEGARASLLERIGYCQASLGQFSQAEITQRKVLSLRKMVLGIDQPQTLDSMNEIGAALRKQGKYKAAETIHITTLARRQEVLGSEHPDTLASMDNLVSTYADQGRWKEAEELSLKVVEISKRVLGAAHLYTVTSIANLTSIYRNQGRWKEAEELGVQVIEIHKRVLGADHPLTLTSIANLAVVNRAQGRWREAEELGKHVLETRKRILGAEHPDTLTMMANLALTYWDQGQWKKAEELGVQVIEIHKRVLGADHPETLTCLANLALTYSSQGRWRKAEELNEQVIETRTRVLGAEHPNTLSSMANLAVIYSDQGRWRKAEELGKHVIETRKRILGAEHPDTLTSMNNLAHTWKAQGKNVEAIALMDGCVQLGSRILGAAHPHTVVSLETLRVWRPEKD